MPLGSTPAFLVQCYWYPCHVALPTTAAVHVNCPSPPHGFSHSVPSPQAGGSLCSAGCWEHCYPQMHSPPVQPLSDLQPAIDQKDLSLICVSRPLGLCLWGSLTSFYFLAEVVCTLICFKAIKIFEGWECYFHIFFPGGQFSDFSQFSPVAQSCLTLCDPMDYSTPGSPVHHQLTELAQTHVHRVCDAIQPPHPLSSPSPPAFNLSQHQSLF